MQTPCLRLRQGLPCACSSVDRAAGSGSVCGGSTPLRRNSPLEVIFSFETNRERRFQMNYKQNYIFYHPFLEQIFDKFPLLKEQIIFYFTSLYAEKDRCIRAPYRMIGDMTLMYGILWKNEKSVKIHV